MLYFQAEDIETSTPKPVYHASGKITTTSYYNCASQKNTPFGANIIDKSAWIDYDDNNILT
jgi:hypothetical protein